MNKTELIAEVALKAGLSKMDAEKALNATVDAITEALVNGDRSSWWALAVSRPRSARLAWAATPRPRKPSSSPLPVFPCSRPARP